MKTAAARVLCLGVLSILPNVEAQTTQHQVSLGVLHGQPNDSSSTLRVVSPVPQEVAGSGFAVGSGTTLGIVYRYRLSDHSSIELQAGVPRRVEVSGTGTVAVVALPSPFRQQPRPAELLGRRCVNHTHFVSARLAPQASAALSAVGWGVVRVTSTIGFSSSWNPVVSIGIDRTLGPALALSASLTYVSLETTATIRTATPAGEAVSQGDLRLNPLLLFVALSRRF